MPPPRVSPPTPVVEMMPPVVASPNACVAWLKSPQVAPPSARAVMRAGIHPNTSHAREVDDDAVVTRAEARHAVAAAPDRQVEAVLGREAAPHAITSAVPLHRDDEQRTTIDHRVVDGPRVVVARVGGGHDLAADLFPQAVDVRHHHLVPLTLVRAAGGQGTVVPRLGSDGNPLPENPVYFEATSASPTAAWPAASRAVSTRKGEQLT